MRRFIEVSILVLLACVVIALSYFTSKPKHGKKPDIVEVEPLPEPKMEYGIVVDSLVIYEGKVKRNQFLSDILLKYNVDYVTIDRLARKSKEVFDVRKIRRGNKYSVICDNDSIRTARYFVYEASPTSYVVFDLRDTINIYRGEKEVTVRLKSIQGSIQSSLWNAIVDKEADPNLANELSEIFAWSIDFFGIQKDDWFKAYYEEQYVGDQYVGLGKVLATQFNHVNNDFYAFYFEQDSVGDYFDEEAGSMRRTFLKAPLRYRRISSRFSYSRMHPILKYRRPHIGIDYSADRGTPVLTVGDGIVFEKGYDKKGGGNYVKIRHNGTYSTTYMHLEGFGKGIKKGKKVRQGDVIGYVGSTGLATGPHLDFRFYRNGKAIDPLKVKSPAAEPVDSVHLERYYNERDYYMGLLNSIQ